MGHSGPGTFIHAKTTSNVYSSFPPMSQQYRIIEEHPEESIITSQIQSLHILVGCKLSSVADTDTITVNLLIDNQIPTIPIIPTIPNIIPQAIELARWFGAWRPILIRMISLNQLGASAFFFVLGGPAWSYSSSLGNNGSLGYFTYLTPLPPPIHLEPAVRRASLETTPHQISIQNQLGGSE